MYARAGLFEGTSPPGGGLPYAAFLHRARGEPEQANGAPDGVAALALGGFVVARFVERTLGGDGDPALWEALQGEREAIRAYLRALPAATAERAHLDAIIDAAPVGYGEPRARLRGALLEYAGLLERAGSLAEALDVVGLAARSHGGKWPPAELAAYGLFAGRLNRLLARWEAADACYGAAETAGRAAGDPVATLRARLGRGAVHRGRGNLPRAVETAEAVAREASARGLPAVEALAYADLGAVRALQGCKLEALAANYEAFRLTPNPAQRIRTLGDLGIGLAEIGALDAARLAFEIVVASDASALVRTNAELELMRIAAEVGDRAAFDRHRAVAEAGREQMTPSMTADYHYKAGTGLARFGAPEQAREALVAGLRVSERHRLNAWYFRLERALGELETGATVRAPAARAPEAPLLDEVMVGLRDYASLAGAGAP